MRRNCHFNINPAFAAGVTLLWISLLIRNVLELGALRRPRPISCPARPARYC